MATPLCILANALKWKEMAYKQGNHVVASLEFTERLNTLYARLLLQDGCKPFYPGWGRFRSSQTFLFAIDNNAVHANNAPDN
jgi:hypothetical protein